MKGVTINRNVDMIQNADILMLMFIPPMLILLCVSGAMLIEELEH